MEGKFLDISLNNIFGSDTPKGKARKAKTKKWSYIKLKSFTQQGKSSKKIKR